MSNNPTGPYNFPIIHHSSQSATSCYMECPRRYLYQYKLYGKGIVPTFASIPLSTGTVIHAGVQDIMLQHTTATATTVDIDKSITIAKEVYTEIVRKHPLAGTEEQEYTFNEQLALTEALLRLWFEMEFPKIVQFYDVLAIEQEIAVSLLPNVVYQSKPDLILIDKKNRDLINYSLKSVKRVDDRLERSYKVQLQAVTEPFCTNEWIKQIKHHAEQAVRALEQLPISNPKNIQSLMKFYIRYLDLPDRSTATRFCYLVKGEWKNEAGRGEEKQYRQNNPLIYGYRNFGPKEIRYAWSWFIPKAENKSGWGVLGKGWEKFPVWKDEEVGGVKGWFDIIKEGEVIQGNLGDGHIFDKYILSQPEVFVNPRLFESRIEQLTSVERELYNRLQWLRGKGKDVDTAFPMNTNSCFFPTSCDYLKICPNGNDEYKEHIAEDPLNKEFGPAFELRVPHHKTEEEYLANGNATNENELD